MRIVEVAGRELSREEIASIRQFRSYTDGVSFACLGEGVMVILDDAPEKDAEKLKAKALEHMDDALRQHPDMTVYNMDDGYRMVALNTGVIAISPEPASEVDMMLSFFLRMKCLKACENGVVIAVAYEEE